MLAAEAPASLTQNGLARPHTSSWWLHVVHLPRPAPRVTRRLEIRRWNSRYAVVDLATEEHLATGSLMAEMLRQGRWLLRPEGGELTVNTGPSGQPYHFELVASDEVRTRPRWVRLG